MIDIQNLSPAELQALIKNAESALEAKQASNRKQVIAQIKELAASIGVTVEITDEKKSRKTSSSVTAKYANPANPSETWTGRGLAPKWMKALTDQGHAKDEFLIK